MYSDELESLIEAALEDGIITAKKRQVLIKKAMAEGIDPDEFELVLDSRVAKLRPNTNDAEQMGKVRKCPFCGARLKATDVVCPECGQEISDKEAALSSRRLAEKLENTRGNEKRVRVIKDFPIPNNAEDLIDFITSMSAKAKSESDEDEKNAYIAKYIEACNKAKIYFPNDDRFKMALKSTSISIWNRLGFFSKAFIFITIALIICYIVVVMTENDKKNNVSEFIVPTTYMLIK